MSFATVRADESGYSLVELLTVMLILSFVLTGLTTLFVSGWNSQLDQDRRFQAQQQARVAMDLLKRDVHCSRAALPGTNATTVILDDPCAAGGYVSWCTAAISGTSWYGLYRSPSATCSSSGIRHAAHLTAANVFSYTQHSSSALAMLHVDLAVNLRPERTAQLYELIDNIALRNSARQCVAASPSDIASPSPPC